MAATLHAHVTIDRPMVERVVQKAARQIRRSVRIERTQLVCLGFVGGFCTAALIGCTIAIAAGAR